MPRVTPSASSTADALEAAGDAAGARDIRALDADLERAARRGSQGRRSLVERLIYGPPPSSGELRAGGLAHAQLSTDQHPIVNAALSKLAAGQAFGADGKLSDDLRRAMAREGAYGFTVPVKFGGLGGSYQSFAVPEADLAANGLGAIFAREKAWLSQISISLGSANASI